VLQLPQFFTSEEKPELAYSQPSAAMPLQSLNPEAQLATIQAPPAHAATAFGVAQSKLHPPQSFGSVAKEEFEYSHPFAEIPSQSLVPAGQLLTWQDPAMQVRPDPQTFVQDPQCMASVANPAVLYSQPSPVEPLQSAKPPLQAPIAHAPVTHVAPAFGKVQRLPHPPQFAGSVSKDEVGYSQPVE
jgi:hypothetical protein